MTTISSSNMIREMLLKGGNLYAEDPLTYSIWQYRTGFGNIAYKIIQAYKGEAYEHNFISTGNIIGKPVCLFKDGLTEDGALWLKETENELARQ